MTRDMRITKPIQSMAPAKAAIIRTQELKANAFPRAATMTRATTSFAPEEIPSVKGPAMGLWKKVCKR